MHVKLQSLKPIKYSLVTLASIIRPLLMKYLTTSFDEHYEVTGVFFDISKAFSKVWHEGIIHKLQCNEIAGTLLSLLTDILKNRKKKLFLMVKVHLESRPMLVNPKILY